MSQNDSKILAKTPTDDGTSTRAYWVSAVQRIAGPVFSAMAEGRLRERMPVETTGDPAERTLYAHLEAVGRSLAGIGPWLNLSNGSPDEVAIRDRLRGLVQESLRRSVDPKEPDCLNFTQGQQPIVDAAFLAQGLLRSWDRIWVALDPETQSRMIDAMRATRDRKPHYNNWLLFSALIEAFLCKAGADWDRMRIDYAFRQHEQWYVGEGYISTGSLYLCLCGMLPLGLPATAPFWAQPDSDWTAKRIWQGGDALCDHAFRG